MHARYLHSGAYEPAEAAKIIAGAIRMNPCFSSQIGRKTVLLIDDVMTAGARINECSRVLCSSRAVNVHALTLARTGGFRS